MTLQRVQMLLDPRQRLRLAELAKAQGKSISEVTRQAIDMGLEQMKRDDPRARMLVALEAASQLRESMRKRNGQPLDINIVEDIRQMREERDEELMRRSGF
jgi:tRNA A37 N6-isopentenylltransferase MiaA